MGAGAGLALKSLQWFLRGLQFGCAAIVLGIYSYFLATLHNHDLTINNWIRAVEGISGAAALYTIIGLLLLCCLAGHPATSFLAILLDTAFVGAFIYVAVQNRGGAGSCTGTVTTPFGTADADTNVDSNGTGFTALPSFHTACKLETACLAVSIVVIFLFIFSAFLEIALVRHRRKEQRFGPSPANNYTSGYGKRRGFNFFGMGRKRRQEAEMMDPNMLPEHTHPDQVRDSYATEQTRVAGGAGTSPVTAAGEGPTIGGGPGATKYEPNNEHPRLAESPRNYQGNDGVWNAQQPQPAHTAFYKKFWGGNAR